MTIPALTNQLSTVEVKLDNIFLDPNNPRFIEHDWNTIPEEQIKNQEVQQEIMERMVRSFHIEKLKMNMEINGYLPIDRVILRPIDDENYVVLEGNRRICAAKMISQYSSSGEAVDETVIKSLESIPALSYTGQDSRAAWIFQGLRHIVGVHEWSAFNKAKLLVEQMEEEDLSLTEVGKRFGLTAHGAGQWVRGYKAYNQAREESDFIKEIDDKCYTYLQELFSRSSAVLRDWLGWDETEYRFKDEMKYNEFISWLYPRSSEGEDSLSTEGEFIPGDWEKRWIPRAIDIRDITYLLKNHPDLFNRFRASGGLDEVHAEALQRERDIEKKKNLDLVQEVFQAVRDCSKALENVPLKAIKDATFAAELSSLLDSLQEKIDFIRE